MKNDDEGGGGCGSGHDGKGDGDDNGDGDVDMCPRSLDTNNADLLVLRTSKKNRPPAAYCCTFFIAPFHLKTQTQTPELPHLSLKLLFRGLRLRFRVHNHNERAHNEWSRRRMVATCFSDSPPQDFAESGPTPN